MALSIDPGTQIPALRTANPVRSRHHLEQVAKGLLTTARPYQWAKNAAVLIVPGLAIFTLGIAQMIAAVAAVGAFSLAASSVYLLNDTMDRNSDRQHPVKGNRPIASGLISPSIAILAALGAAAAGLLLGFAISTAVGAIVAAYLTITAGYSMALKHIPIVDIGVLASGFVLRVLAGTAAVGAAVPWLLLAAVFWAASLVALGKRRSEAMLLGESAADHRRTLGTYTVPFLEQSLIDTQLLSVLSFAAWAYTSVAPPFAIAVGLVAGVSLHLALGAYRRSLIGTGGGGDPTRELASNPLVLVGLAAAGLTALSTGLI